MCSLTAPLREGPRAEGYFFTPDREIETWPGVYFPLPVWKRRYLHVDAEKGVAWDLWIEDCDLFVRSEGNSRRALSLLLADWHEKFAFNETGEKWHKRVTEMFEKADQQQMAKLKMRSAVGAKDL